MNGNPFPVTGQRQTNSREAACKKAADQAEQKISDMLAGDEFEYHRGYLAADRLTDPSVDGVSMAVRRAVNAGLGVVLQRRVDFDECAYVFRRNSVPLKRTKSSDELAKAMGLK